MEASTKKYRVHKFEVEKHLDNVKLEHFINRLEGEVVSIIPNNKKTSLFQIYGLTSKIDYLLVVEKII